MVVKLELEGENGEVFEAAGRLPSAGVERRVLQLQEAEERREPYQAGQTAAERRPP